MKISNPGKFKIIMLVLMVAVVSAGTAIVNYAHGTQVIDTNQHMFMISHTEYRYSEMGQIIVRLVDFQDNAIAVNNCTASILYPNKTFFVQDALMNDSVNIAGDHYYNFTTPNGPEGVYEYQATCNYDPNKQKSATNSFHLSSAFSSVFNDLAAINSTIVDFRTEVQSNFSTVYSMISNINVTADVAAIQTTLNQVNSTVNIISSNLTSFVSDTQTRLDEINVTTQATAIAVTNVQTTLDALNLTVVTQFDQVDAYMSSNFSTIIGNLSALNQLIVSVNASIIDAINAISISVNLTPVLDAIDAVNLSISSDISDFRTEVQANFSTTFVWLDYINTTTTSTYDYVTGTLATNVNSVLTTLGVINATVNRIEANVSQILQNQEDEVYISAFSG